jgi:hypothetical protein
MSSSSHPFNIGPQGPTGDPWVHPFEWNSGGASGYAATGSSGPTGPAGSLGNTGPTGETGPVAIGVTYSSTGPNAHHLILQYNDVGGQAVTADAGYYRGPTGDSIYYLRGENTGYATAGVLWKDSVNGVLYLKSITGGNGLRIEDNEDKIRVRYTTFDAVTAHGPTGGLVYAKANSAGTTGLSGATLTHYYGGPTHALKATIRKYNEVSSRISPWQFDEEYNTFIYKINPIDALSLEAARAEDYGRLSGTVFVVDPNKDYELWWGGPPTDEQKPFVRFLDSSESSNNPDEYLEKFTPFSSSGFTLIVIDGKTTGERINRNVETVSYPYYEVFPKNWKFGYSLSPTLSNDIDIVQFITLGNTDTITEKIEWYGMYVRTEKDNNPFSW